MYKNEFRNTTYISLIYCFRMIGLFIIFPIFSLYINHLDSATPFLIGLALGVYGLTQAMLQIVLSVVLSPMSCARWELRWAVCCAEA